MVATVVLDVLKAVIVRGVLALHVIMTIWRVTVNYNDEMYWLLTCALFPFLLEALFNLIKRRGREFLWFTPCFVFYLCAELPGIWLLELDKTEKYQEGREDEPVNETDTELIPVDINPKMWLVLIEEMMPYFLIISRWLLPRGEVTREQLSELLFAFIGIAADIMEFFSLFGEDDVRRSDILPYCVLGIWSFSLLQFCMTLTVTHSPKRARKIKVIDEEPDEAHERRKLRNECFAIFLSMFMQDIPFVTLRLYVLITYNIVTYSLIFFTSKNILVVMLLFYKIGVICQKRYCPDPEDEDEDEEMTVNDKHHLQPHGRKHHRITNENKDLKKFSDMGFTSVQQKSEDKSSGKKHSENKKTKTKPKNGQEAVPYTISNDAAERSRQSTARQSKSSSGSGDKISSSAKSPPSIKESYPSTPEMRLDPHKNSDDSTKRKSKSPKASPSPSRTSSGRQSRSSYSSQKQHSLSRLGKQSDDMITNNTPSSHPASSLTNNNSASSSNMNNGPAPQNISLTPYGLEIPRPQVSPSPSRRDPTITNPKIQTAKPGEPDFKPYVSVLSL